MGLQAAIKSIDESILYARTTNQRERLDVLRDVKEMMIAYAKEEGEDMSKVPPERKYHKFPEDSELPEKKTLEEILFDNLQSGYLRYLNSDDEDNMRETARRASKIAEQYYKDEGWVNINNSAYLQDGLHLWVKHHGYVKESECREKFKKEAIAALDNFMNSFVYPTNPPMLSLTETESKIVHGIKKAIERI